METSRLPLRTEPGKAISRLCGKSFVRRKPIYYQPIQSQILDRLSKLLKIHWFLDVTVYPEFVAVDHIALFSGGGEYNNGNGTRNGVGLDLSENFQSVDLRQFQVQKNQFRRMVR